MACTNHQDAARAIAHGHAFYEHAHEFDVAGPAEFETIILGILNTPTNSKRLSNGRQIFWDSQRSAVVIVNPNDLDCGTAFVPSNGKLYFDTRR